jgi:hypothetical protein
MNCLGSWDTTETVPHSTDAIFAAFRAAGNEGLCLSANSGRSYNYPVDVLTCGLNMNWLRHTSGLGWAAPHIGTNTSSELVDSPYNLLK